MAEHTHQFDCKQCGAHLDSQRDLDEHNRQMHQSRSASSGNSGSSGSSGSSSGGKIS